MGRQNTFPVAGKSDSDQSISDEEDFNGDLGEKCVSLTGNTHKEKEEGWGLQSRLDMLRGTDEQNCGNKIGNSVHEKQTSVFVEDEVEMPDLPNEGGFVFSPRRGSAHNSNDEVVCIDGDNYAFLEYSIISSKEEFVSDSNVGGFRSKKQAEACAWSMVNKEAETLISLNENSSSSHSAYSKANKSCKGIRGKAKPKFAFQFQSHKDGLSQPFSCKTKNASYKVDDGPERLETIEHKILENSSPVLYEDFCGENVNLSEIEPAEVEAFDDGFVDYSMAELLDGLQDKNILPRGNSKMYSRAKAKRGLLVMKRSVSLLGDRYIDGEDQPELMASGSSSDDETYYQNLNLADLETKKQTMADRFQEALAAASVSNEGVIVKTSGIGLSGKLQKVMQSEKERDTKFLKKLQMVASPGESCSFVVKILSRYFDAKLIVCHCTFGENIKGSQSAESSKTFVNRGRTRTVIFSPRVCSNVDLDVGNLICIYPPWKEVEVVGNDEFVMLTTYFSQIPV